MEHKDCLFCKIANKEIETKVIYENEKIISFLDIDPINEGHILIIPKKHYLDVDELDKETAVAIMEASMRLTKLLKRMYKPEGYSIMQNGGKFNDVGHYHMHIFPRYSDDGFGWSYREDDVDKVDLEEVREKLLEELKCKE